MRGSTHSPNLCAFALVLTSVTLVSVGCKLFAGGAALLLHLHGLPGYTRITTQAQLAAR